MASVRSDENDSEEKEEEEEISSPEKLEDGNASLVGMVFNSIEDAKAYYRDFGERNGFKIRKRTTYTSKTKSSKKIGALFVCVCEGKHKMQKTDIDDSKISTCTSTIKSGCSAKMRIKWCKETDSWECSRFDNNHNHALVRPNKRNHMRRSRKKMSQSTKDLPSTFKEKNIGTANVAALYGLDATFDKEKNIGTANVAALYGIGATFDKEKNMKWFRSINYEEHDVQGVKRYLQEMAAKDPYFFYSVQCDNEGREANFFWVDAQSRRAYSQFGDAVTFDTTYRTNRYSVPFAPFTGVNHHHQSILFGCAILENEQECTFIWLFETWLQAMGGKAPISIITHQDVVMEKAIGRVFPHTRHRFCLWHIKKKFVERFSHIYVKKSKFKRAVKKCTRVARSIEDFEVQWGCLVQEYGLDDHSWLKSMYDIRRSWIPIYCRDTFFAGLNTTQRNENIDSFFNGFIDSKTDLMEFVTKYTKALETIYVSERKEDYDSRYTKRALYTKDLFLAHAAKIYTRKMFTIVAEEVEDVVLLLVDEKSVDGDIYKLLVFYKVGNREEFVVTFNLTTKMGSCECQLFEFLGIPCKHLMKVWDHFRIYEIPTQFILKRWCKDANQSTLFDSDGLLIGKNNDEVVSQATRVSELYKLSAELSHEAGKSEMGCKLYKNLILKTFGEIQRINEVVLHQENNEQVDDNGQQ